MTTLEQRARDLAEYPYGQRPTIAADRVTFETKALSALREVEREALERALGMIAPDESFDSGEAHLALQDCREKISGLISALIDTPASEAPAPRDAEIERRTVEMPLSDANDLDAVVRALGIEDSDTTPTEAVAELKAEIERLRVVVRTMEWQPTRVAPQHVQDAASVIIMQLGWSRVRLHYGPGAQLHALLIEGSGGSHPTRWVRLPDLPEAARQALDREPIT